MRQQEGTIFCAFLQRYSLAIRRTNTIILLYIRVALFKGQTVIYFFSQIRHRRQKIFAFAHSHKSSISKHEYLLQVPTRSKKKVSYSIYLRTYWYTYEILSISYLGLRSTLSVYIEKYVGTIFTLRSFPLFSRYPVNTISTINLYQYHY